MSYNGDIVSNYGFKIEKSLLKSFSYFFVFLHNISSENLHAPVGAPYYLNFLLSHRTASEIERGERVV